jgi:hypothetical protein
MNATSFANARSRDSPAAVLCGLPRFNEFTDFIGLPEIQEPEQRFTTVPVDTSS